MSTYTPGPWTAVGDEIYGSDGTRIAEAVRTSDMSLLLAAPALLQALRGLEVLFWPVAKDSTQAFWIDQARAAIAKAEGEAT